MNDENDSKKTANTGADEHDDVTIEPIKGATPKPKPKKFGEMGDDLEAAEADDVVMDDEASPADQTKKLRAQLAKAVQEKQEYLDGWQRARAELINLRKRDEEEKREFMKYASEGLIADILPTLDSFEMARANKEAWEKVDKNWRTGVEYIQSQLMQALESRGLKVIDPLGQPFDPMRDEAIEYVPVTSEADDHKVMQVIQKGYMLGDKSVKAPKVKIGKWEKK